MGPWLLEERDPVRPNGRAIRRRSLPRPPGSESFGVRLSQRPVAAPNCESRRPRTRDRRESPAPPPLAPAAPRPQSLQISHVLLPRLDARSTHHPPQTVRAPRPATQPARLKAIPAQAASLSSASPDDIRRGGEAMTRRPEGGGGPPGNETKRASPEVSRPRGASRCGRRGRACRGCRRESAS